MCMRVCVSVSVCKSVFVCDYMNTDSFVERSFSIPDPTHQQTMIVADAKHNLKFWFEIAFLLRVCWYEDRGVTTTFFCSDVFASV